MENLALLISAERSGTHFIRSIINNNNSGCAYWEVANAEVEIEDTDLLNYFEFKSKHQTKHKDFPRPTIEFTNFIINLYIDYCIDYSKNNIQPLILDIKYTHLINFTNGWYDFNNMPVIFSIAEQRGIPIIHLKRKNLFQNALSLIYAEATNTWMLSNGEILPSQIVYVSREHLISKKMLLESAMRLVENWLSSCKNIEIFYEDLFDLSSSSWGKLQLILSKKVLHLNSDYVKILSNYQSQISNYDEIRDLIVN